MSDEVLDLEAAERRISTLLRAARSVVNESAGGSAEPSAVSLDRLCTVLVACEQNSDLPLSILRESVVYWRHTRGCITCYSSDPCDCGLDALRARIKVGK